MCTQSSVRTFISQFITRLETVFEKIPYSKSRITEEIKWSDIIAGRHSNVPGINPTTAQSIETVITSKPTHYYNRTCASTTSRTTQPQSARKDSMNRQDGRSRVIILGDSHTRGTASELLQQSNHQFHTTGYVKPNARLPELLRTAKSELNKLSSKDTVIVNGGSNDIGRSDLNSNLTSIVKFLDDLQPTNVILAEIPLRYDIGATLHISDQIKQYNKKLGKVTKSYKQVKLIKITTNREHYTKYGLHLNSRGKESMAKELLINLQVKPVPRTTSVIHLQWKQDVIKVGDQIIQDESLHVLSNKVIGTDVCKASSSIVGKNSSVTRIRMEADLKAMSASNVQQDINRELCKVSCRSLKIQQNCPKVKNDDFLWN